MNSARNSKSEPPFPVRGTPGCIATRGLTMIRAAFARAWLTPTPTRPTSLPRGAANSGATASAGRSASARQGRPIRPRSAAPAHIPRPYG